MRSPLSEASRRRRLASGARGARRRRINAAVRRGEAVADPADAGLAAVQAANVLRRVGRRGPSRPFGRDALLVAPVAVVLVLLTDTGWVARAGLLMLLGAVVLVAELLLDATTVRRRENAARAERENLALLFETLAERHSRRPVARRPRLALPAGSEPSEPRVEMLESTVHV
jgi:hypothetical protein